MNKPSKPMDTYDFVNAVANIDGDLKAVGDVYVRVGMNADLYPITLIEVDADGDIVLKADK